MKDSLKAAWQDVRKRTRGLLLHWAISSTVIFTCLCLYRVWLGGGIDSLANVVLIFLAAAILTPPVLLVVWLLLY